MPTDALTPEAIRVLDGPALTRLAWKLGLAPEEGHGRGELDEGMGTWTWWDKRPGNWTRWEPYVNLAQADAVFRSLRARGFRTFTTFYPDTKPPFGDVQAWKPTNGETFSVPYTLLDLEPLALLRCSVLAVASEQKE